MELEINRKQFSIGSIVYFIDKSAFMMSGRWVVKFGVVEENYTTEICLQLYEPKIERKINGVPEKELQTPTRWFKIPKDWSYDTKLIEVEQVLYPELCSIKLNNPEELLQAIEKGFLVKVQDNDHRHFETEIDKKYGWRIVRISRIGEHHTTYISLDYRDVYATYEEAQAVIDERTKEFERQANLTDLEWSIEQIDHQIDRWAYMKNVSDEEKKAIRDRFLALDDLENIEVRYVAEGLQWKHIKHKKWKTIGEAE